MANYALKNIKDLEDSAVQFGLAPHVEARFGRKALAAEKGGFSYQKLEPGYRQGFGHRHAEQEETYVVIAGNGRAKVGDEIVELKRLDALRVSPQTWRAFEGGDEGLEFLVFGAGASGDAEMSAEFWPAADAP
jgi:mannose-6-phosphate isomerase-like protein (cupin superfamily)